MLAICVINDMVKVQTNSAPDLKVQILHTIFIQGEMDIILLILVKYAKIRSLSYDLGHF